MSRKVPFWSPIRLSLQALRDFSDSFITEFSEVARRAPGTLPRRPAAGRSDDITDQLERRWARWHDAGVGLPPSQTLPLAPFSAGAPGPMLTAGNEAKVEETPCWGRAGRRPGAVWPSGRRIAAWVRSCAATAWSASTRWRTV